MRTQITPEAVTDYYQTYEAREKAFNHEVGRLIPARHRGPRHFWEDFRELTDVAHRINARAPAHITSNPRDCLAFGSAEQVLSAELCCNAVEAASLGQCIKNYSERFNLTQVLKQPIRSLSGGETIRLALAKVFIGAEKTNRLIIASPFCWLSRNHAPLLQTVIDHYQTKSKPVKILAMEGENDSDPLPLDWAAGFSSTPIAFGLTMKNLSIGLGSPIGALRTKPVAARVSDCSIGLASPCLIVGNNGQGKSLLAKTLCGAMIFHGNITIESIHGRKRPRLLFQDVITQTLLRNLDALVNAPPSLLPLDPLSIKQTIVNHYHAFLKQMKYERHEPAAQSLLEIKTVLIALRLAEQPGALFLDEPDWGLSRPDAVAFVFAVVRIAHEMGVPVLIISHKPWWGPMAASVLAVTKTPSENPDILFTISTTLVTKANQQ